MPAFASASVQHSRIYRDGVSSAAIVLRLGESISYTLAVTFGAAGVAEHATTVVRRMHAHGAALGHLRYHPRPLTGSDLDDFYADWAVIGRAMGATDLPETAAEVATYLDETAPTLAVTPDTLTALRMFEGRRGSRTRWRPNRCCGPRGTCCRAGPAGCSATATSARRSSRPGAPVPGRCCWRCRRSAARPGPGARHWGGWPQDRPVGQCPRESTPRRA